MVEKMFESVKGLERSQRADRSPGCPEETLESAGCTGGCPTYPGAPKTKDGYPDCSKCPQMMEDS